MTYKLFALTYRVARAMRVTMQGSFTAALTDTVHLQNEYEDDYWNKGTCWILYDAGGAKALPQGEYRTITDFVNSTGVLTVDTAFTAATAAGDQYALAPKAVSLYNLIHKINEVLDTIPIKQRDTTTLDTAANKTEYQLPTTILSEDIEVWRQDNTGDTDDNLWLQHHDWHIIETGTGSQKLLVFHENPVASRDLQIVYKVPHPPMYVNTDELHEAVDINRVVYAAAYELLLEKKSRLASMIPDIDGLIAEMGTKAAAAASNSPNQNVLLHMAPY